LLFTWVNETNFCANFCGVELDHVIAQTLHCSNDFTLQEQEANYVCSAAV